MEPGVSVSGARYAWPESLSRRAARASSEARVPPGAPGSCGVALRPPRGARGVDWLDDDDVAAGGHGLLAVAVALFLGLGAGLLDLAAVRLEAGAGLGVLPLPLLALRVVARQPLAGLRVEALGVLVVARLVVGGGHAVEGRVELVAGGLADRALVGLLERQARSAAGPGRCR